LTAEQQKNCYATDRGWVYKNAKGLEEVLVAVGQLAGTTTTTGLGAADINSLEFVTSSFSEAAGGTISVKVIYNEKVTVDTTGGTPSITLTNGQEGSGTDATVDLDYASGSGTNQLTFTATIAADDGGVAADDVLSIGDQNIALNSGTMKDTASSTVDAKVAISGVTATLTAVA
jgi:hypothetical protein